MPEPEFRAKVTLSSADGKRVKNQPPTERNGDGETRLSVLFIECDRWRKHWLASIRTNNQHPASSDRIVVVLIVDPTKLRRFRIMEIPRTRSTSAVRPLHGNQPTIAIGRLG